MNFWNKREVPSEDEIPDWEFDIEGQDVIAITYDASLCEATIEYLLGDELLEFEVYSTIDQHNEMIKRFRAKKNLSGYENE